MNTRTLTPEQLRAHELQVVLGRIASRRDVVLGELHQELRVRVEALLADDPRFAPWTGYRGPKEQDAALRLGQSELAWPHSAHNHVLAFACDVVLHPSFVKVAQHPDAPSTPWLWDSVSPEAVKAWAALERAAAKHGLARVNVRGLRDRPHLELPNWRALAKR